MARIFREIQPAGSRHWTTRHVMSGGVSARSERRPAPFSIVRRISAVLKLLLARGPSGLDECKDLPDFFVAEGLAKAGHPAGKALEAQLLGNRLSAKLRIFEEILVRMVPGMAGLVMWRRRVNAVISRCLPILLTLQRGTMAACAVLGVEVLTFGQIAAIKFMSGQCGECGDAKD